MIARLATLLTILAAALAASTLPRPEAPIVHEWGTFTSIASEDGGALEWRPLNGPIDLPGFVLSTCLERRFNIKLNWRARIRMETPVLYFYTSRETTVSVRVDFPKGQISEWYPQARWIGQGIDWGPIEISPAASAAFPVDGSENHYYAARETDAATVRVSGQQEKFLFYRGLGNFDPPLSVRRDGNRLRLKNLGGVQAVIVFENRGGKTGYVVQDITQSELTLDRPTLGRPADSVEGELERILIAHGLYEKEAKAMIRTWRNSWFEEGLRVFYVVPSEVTDSVLPLTIDPRPAELVRVLVGRIEVITPEMEDAVRAALSGGSTALGKYGRFSEPLLLRLLQTAPDPATRAQIQQLLNSSNAVPACR